MQFVRTEQFKRDYASLPKLTRKKTEQKLRLLAVDFRHPSIRTKRIQGTRDLWEGRIDRFYRFTFQLEEDKIILRRVGTHDILRKISSE